MHLALARKYRPQNFLEVIGQDPIIQTLQNMIETDRVHHAYLFCGVRGIGKTSMARIMAKSLNCENGPSITPCQTCANCVGITAGNNLDVLEIDGASNNLVDDMRELREQVKYLPTNSKYKIIIIDEVHMLSKSAFNALLKTLEEPPAHAIFIFATTEAHKVPVTILSRCQKFDCRKLSSPLLLSHLKNIVQKEAVKIEDAALHLIVQCAQGSVRDAMSLLDQIANLKVDLITEDSVRQLLGLGERLLVQESFQALINEDLNAGLAKLTELDSRGVDLKLFAESLLTQYRHLILIQSTGHMPAELSPTEVDFFKSIKDKLDLSLLLAQYQVLLQGIQELSRTEYQKTSLEVSFVKLHQIRNMIGLTELVDQIKNKAAPKATAPQPQVPPTQSPAPTRQSSSRKAPTEPTQKAPAVASDWYQFAKWINKEKPPLGGLLKDVVPLTFSGDQIQVAIAPKAQAKSMLIERISTIESMIETHFGKKIPFSITDLEPQKKKP